MVQSCVIMYYPPAGTINLTNRLRAHFKSLDSLYILYSLTNLRQHLYLSETLTFSFLSRASLELPLPAGEGRGPPPI